MKKLPLLSALVSSIIIVGCVPESDSDDPLVGESYSFTANAVIRDNCGIDSPNMNAVMVIHNADLTTKEVISPDSDGKLSYTSKNKTENITIAYRLKEAGVDSDEIYARTYVDAPASNFGEFRVFSNLDETTSCSCNSEDVTVMVPSQKQGQRINEAEIEAASLGNGKSSFYSDIYDYSGEVSLPVTICQSSSGNDSITLSARLEYGDWSDPEMFATFDDDYQIGSSLSANMAASEVAGTVEHPVGFEVSYLRTQPFINNQPLFAFTDVQRTKDNEWGDSTDFTVKAFSDSSFSLHRYSTSAWLMDDYDQDIRYNLFTSSYVDTLRSGEILSLNHMGNSIPDIEIDGNSYDFSSVSNYQAVRHSFRGWSSGASELDSWFSWSVYTPLKSTMPNFENLELGSLVNVDDIPRLLELNSLQYDFELLGYKASIDDYEEILELFAGEFTDSTRLGYQEFRSFRVSIDIELEDDLFAVNPLNAKKAIAKVTAPKKLSSNKVTKTKSNNRSKAILDKLERTREFR